MSQKEFCDPVAVFQGFRQFAWALFMQFWGVAKGSSVSWVAKFKGGKNPECKLSNGWSRSYKVIKLLLSAGK